MIKNIEWHLIYPIWEKYLWPERTSPIKSHSAMMYLNGHSMKNYDYRPSFLGYFKDNSLIGVNSCHKCSDGSLRSRGLWVHPDHRNQGIGYKLLKQTIEFKGNATFVWSYPRKSSWRTYENVGFYLTSDWESSETSEANAYCRLD